MSLTRKIFFFIALPLVLIFLIVFGLNAFKSSSNPQVSTKEPETTELQDKPAPLKNIGFNLDYYNEATKKAGDLHFTAELSRILSSDPIYQKQVWRDYGIQDIRSPNDPTKRNVQPTFYLPLDTKVLAPIDGVVTKVETLYSDDYTIWFAVNSKSEWSYETEHVKNVTVKVGDRVTASQVVAEVSDYSTKNTPGFGLVELGLFKQINGEPAHWCPFEYLDSTIKEETLKKITSIYIGWEKFMGDTTIYNESTYAMPGCATLEPTKG